MADAENKDRILRVMLKCNRKGAVNEILLDHAGIFSEKKVPVQIHEVISPDSLEALGDFWVQVTDQGMQEHIQLHVKYLNESLRFTFSGYLIHDNILLCGSTETAAVEKAMDEIMQIYSEQLNMIRLAEKKVKLAQSAKDNLGINGLMLNDFTELNNELINKQRELSRKNKEVNLLNSELQAARDSMEMFAYSISHDLKEPVRMVNAFMGRIKEQYEDRLDDKGKRYLGFALDGSLRLGNMIDDLLHFYRATNNSKQERVDLNEILAEVKVMLRRQLRERNARIFSDQLPVIAGNAVGLKQVFQNLISNALKFVPEKTVPEINISAVENEASFELRLADNGIGIDKSHYDEIFKLFKQLEHEKMKEGSGMGLAIVRRIVNHMGGKIWLHSEKGTGTTFYISLPK
ncbi:Histidine kinase-, DNA gyrase B-, and HSP90-like ATPase [Cyclobacterium lianum]|uniref:histidine kinase n=1 Tax=Cyclobacterium lianum TaxID=388280 RepID=A0A1M7LJM4_9BACT|nr:ATP-binding protein [Cyclobacterium lianum]SHM77774.1 Histidine kinase-, DNA gyrase B-, and HSP90-like ATPase [Cyclobacterium lianum]